MFSSSANSSSATLTATLPQKASQKNYEAAFGALSSTYGFGSGAMMPTPTPKTSKKTSMPAASSCTASPTPSTSTTKAAPSSQKNYEAAFGLLASSYGFGGHMPPNSDSASLSTSPMSIHIWIAL
ncbi:hypothetical protein H0H87_009779 [Tephrocybe sp. NHM501043]|nr:hypothetical protein H0H87_009779 [Tephrocybe sp. NHM501043]